MSMYGPGRQPGVIAYLLALAMTLTRLAAAQDAASPQRPADRHAFSLSSAEIFRTTSSPYVTLTFERLGGRWLERLALSHDRGSHSGR